MDLVKLPTLNKYDINTKYWTPATADLDKQPTYTDYNENVINSILEYIKINKTVGKLNLFPETSYNTVNNTLASDIKYLLTPIGAILSGINGEKITPFIFNDKNSEIQLGYTSIQLQSVCYLLNVINKNTHVIILSKYAFIYDTIEQYQKYVLFNTNYRNISAYIMNTKSNEYSQLYMDKLKKNNISYKLFDEEIDIEVKTEGTDNLYILDCTLRLDNKKLDWFRSTYSLKFYVKMFLSIVKNMPMKSNIIFFIPRIINKVVYSFILYIASLFENAYMYKTVYGPHPFNSCFIFKNYRSGADISGLQSIIDNITSSQLDFVLTSQYDIDIIQRLYPKYKYKTQKSNYVWPIKIINIDQLTLDKQFESYTQTILSDFSIDYDNLQSVLTIDTDKKLYNKKMDELVYQSAMFCRQVGIPLLEWIEDKKINKHLFYRKKKNEIIGSIDPYNRQFKYECKDENIGEYDSITNIDTVILDDIYKISENVYSYVDTTNPKAYKSIELMFNFYQKKLEKFLFNKFSISTNGRYVNRAWIKLYELYTDTKYFDNLLINNNKKITALHICEAPGNFINCSKYVVETIHKSQYEWNAQSLKDSSIFDDYGFIKKTIDRWDFADGTGDITIYDNLIHYMTKYSNVDTLVGDCGIPWSAESNISSNVSISQLFYALVIPRIGGNFVIKTYATNHNKLYLALLQVIICYYDKTIVFKSSRNIWSPEIYIVGIGKHKMSKEFVENILTIAKNLSNSNYTYPISYMNDSFLSEYEYITNHIVDAYVDIKKIFVFLARNYDLFKNDKQSIEQILDDKNKYWLTKYFNHLPNIGSTYTIYK